MALINCNSICSTSEDGRLHANCYLSQHYIKTSGSVSELCVRVPCIQRIDGHLWVIEGIASFAGKNREVFAQFMIFLRKIYCCFVKIFTTILTNFLGCCTRLQNLERKTSQNSHKIYDWYLVLWKSSECVNTLNAAFKLLLFYSIDAVYKCLAEYRASVFSGVSADLVVCVRVYVWHAIFDISQWQLSLIWIWIWSATLKQTSAN